MDDNQMYMVLITRRDNTPVEYISKGYRQAIKAFNLAEEYASIDSDLLCIELYDGTGRCLERVNTYPDPDDYII